ncbi:MAG: hypothetical protein R3Y47_05165 [Lachnospiraceae bacterium]
MKGTSCVITKYNRYTNLCFVEVGCYKGERLVCGCVVLPSGMMILEDIETIQMVKGCFETWFAESLLVGALYGDILQLQKEVARGFHALEKSIVDSSYEVCLFVSLGKFFCYKCKSGSVYRFEIGGKLLFASRKEIVGSYDSTEVFVNMLEKSYIENLGQASEHAFFILIGDVC